MATKTYFEKDIKNTLQDDFHNVEFGVTNFDRGGQKMYLKFNEEKLILSESDAKEIIEKMIDVGIYLGYIDPQ